ncbi:peptidase M28 [Peniophora sp. CONT]|nr:peptidase M28 [Peniophora sp. CONT]
MSSQTDPKRGIGAAQRWLEARMGNLTRGVGHAKVEVQTYEQPASGSILFPVNISNVVTTFTGSVTPNRVYIITGHFDSRNTNNSDFTNDAPGADDDGSGVSVVLELIRVFSKLPPPKATIMLGAVSGEEQGLLGSTNFANITKAAGLDVQGMFTNDIVGSSKGDPGSVDPHTIRLFAQGVPTFTETLAQVTSRVSVGGENDSPARELARFAADVATNSVTDMNVAVVYRLDRFLRGGDHEPFLRQGFPAARFTEPHENFAHQHQDVRVQNGVQFGDLPEFCDFPFTARVARVNGATIWSLANAPSTPKNVTIDTSVLTNNSTLTWDVDSESGLTAGYEVLWRATDAPRWTNVIGVGFVGKATVDVSKDNAILAVRAVGRDGMRSPGAFPLGV